MFGGGNRVPAWRVHHDHPSSGGLGHINIVDSHTGASDNPELRSSVQHHGGDFRLAADYDSAEIRNDFCQIGFAQAGLGRNFERAVARQFVDATLRNRIRDQNLRYGHMSGIVAALPGRGEALTSVLRVGEDVVEKWRTTAKAILIAFMECKELRWNFSNRARELSGGDVVGVSIPKSGRT